MNYPFLAVKKVFCRTVTDVRCYVLALLTDVSLKLWRIQIEMFYQYTAWSLPLDLEEQKCDLKK